MQKFGPDSLKTEKAGALEREIAKEKAGALGAAGRKLQQSLDRYRQLARGADAATRQERLTDDIAANAWALIVQREALGLRHENFKWVLQNYDIPEAALMKLGLIEK